ncbi:unnamed protein product [Trichogramma brassicae]|uniref:DNA-directed DNA polymerase n=1 Tax=Trichogramma brassicae TaxID=86971 RepID=A0A6H5J2K3_9HYME|nr:unnamed protein product [Trichogramma brassicae]
MLRTCLHSSTIKRSHYVTQRILEDWTPLNTGGSWTPFISMKLEGEQEEEPWSHSTTLVARGEANGDGDNANVGGDANGGEADGGVTPTMPTLTVTPTVVVRPMAVTPTTPTLAVTATVVRPMAVTPTTPTLTVTPTVQKPWLKSYIDLNTDRRKKADNDFDKSFFKLLVNSCFGKFIENKRKRVVIHLVNHWHKRYGASYYIAHPNFHSIEYFNENFVAIQMSETSIRLDKPMVSSRRGQPAKYHRFQSFYIRVFDNCDAQVYVILSRYFLVRSCARYHQNQWRQEEYHHPKILTSSKENWRENKVVVRARECRERGTCRSYELDYAASDAYIYRYSLYACDSHMMARSLDHAVSLDSTRCGNVLCLALCSRRTCAARVGLAFAYNIYLQRA